MGFLDNFRRKETPTITKEVKMEDTNSTVSKKETPVYQSFGSPLVKIGKGDLTKPFINGTNIYNSTFVYFGADNRFPQLIDQMYYQSPLHSSIIDFQVNACIGGGFRIDTIGKKTGVQTVNEMTFLKKIKAPKLLRAISLDLKMHRRIHLFVTKKDNDVVKIERIPPAKVAIIGIPSNMASHTLLGLLSICDG